MNFKDFLVSKVWFLCFTIFWILKNLKSVHFQNFFCSACWNIHIQNMAPRTCHIISNFLEYCSRRRECKKSRCFPWKVPSHNKCWKNFQSAINIALRARNAITICYAWPADKFTFITPTKNRGTPRNPFPTAIFHKLAKIDAFQKKCHFSIPILKAK